MNKSQNLSKEQIILKEQEFAEAMLNADLNALDFLLHEDLLFNIPGGQVITKQMDLDAYKAGLMKLDVFELQQQEVSLIEDIGIVSSTALMTGTYGEHLFDGRFKIIRVWKQFNDSPQVIAGSSMPIQ